MVDSIRKIKNISKLLKKRLPVTIFNIIREIGAMAQDCGFSAYIVGGFVRDLLLGVENLDLDIVVEGDALDFIELLKEKMDLMDLDVSRHQRFGTATATLPSGFKIDFASARKEHYAYAAAFPQVTFSSIREDLSRRDFTVNALAMKINRQDFGLLLDLFSGQKDLQEKKIRVLHNKSFVDDPTRILRAIRFEQRYNFTIERDTEDLLKEALREKMLKKLSRFRVGDELIWILKEEAPLKSLLRISKFAGLTFIHPRIKLNQELIKQFKLAQQHIRWFLGLRPQQELTRWLVYFIILTGRLNLIELKKLCRAFSLIRKDIQKVESAQKNSKVGLKRIEKAGAISAAQIYQLLAPFSKEELLVFLTRTRSKKAKDRIRLFLRKLSLVKIELTGNDLKRLGIKPGPRYREILEQVLYAKIDGKLKSKPAQLNFIRDGCQPDTLPNKKNRPRP